MNTEIIKITFPLFLLIVLLSFYVNAFAVSMPYLEGKTIVLHPGATSDFELVLQNMVGDTDETAMVTIEEGTEIARIIDKSSTYKVPRGTKDTVVHIKISIPNDAPLGKEWTVRFKATPVTQREKGMVQISGGVSDYFKVKTGPATPVKKELPKQNLGNILYLLGAFTFVVILVLFAHRKKKKNTEPLPSHPGSKKL